MYVLYTQLFCDLKAFINTETRFCVLISFIVEEIDTWKILSGLTRQEKCYIPVFTLDILFSQFIVYPHVLRGFTIFRQDKFFSPGYRCYREKSVLWRFRLSIQAAFLLSWSHCTEQVGSSSSTFDLHAESSQFESGWDSNYPDWGFLWFSSVPPDK
jgi:hypothetical protein